MCSSVEVPVAFVLVTTVVVLCKTPEAHIFKQILFRGAENMWVLCETNAELMSVNPIC